MNASQIVRLCLRDVDLDLVRASGPGGQNVNKVATAVQLRFGIRTSPHLSAGAKQRLRARAGHRVTADGTLVIQASRHRTQAQNREDALQRFRALLEEALVPPKRRVPTKVSAASKQRRLLAKKRRGELKRTRRDLSD